jgi:HlyD family secretion protein
MKKLLSLLVLLGAAGGGVYYWHWHVNASSGVRYKTVKVRRGSLVATISSTGTLEPENVIDIGAQVSGMVEEFGRDPQDPSKRVDYGTQVDKGTVLARLDPSLYQARVNQAKASLDQARANLKLRQAQLNNASREWQRIRHEWARSPRSVSQSDYDTAQANYEVARANIGVSQAAIEQAQHSLDEAETNLRYCTIVSKAKGVIVDRRVNIGQTVVASLQAPSLFLIATDLSRMQVWASVNEADIGQIKKGQLVRFTVDAHPDRTFEGKVAKIRLNASMTQNVVTYTVEVDVDNARYGNVLLPYLTTNLQFVVAEKKDVLLVPSTALRWRPQLDQVAPDIRDAYAQSLRQRKAQGGLSSLPSKPGNDRKDQGMVWVQDGDFVRPVEVHIGLTDGTLTEIRSGLKEADRLVVGVEQQGGGSGTSNPFAPKIFGGKKEQ